MSDFDDSYRLIYADEPRHVRLAGAPWAGIAKVVEGATAVLEDGQRKLAEVWRSPGGAAYLAEMARVVAAMRATSEAARHNDQVMSAAADTLNGKQKDFAVLSTAPIPADARERYARAIVNSLDEDYQQAVANFRPVPAVDPSLRADHPLIPVDDPPPSSSGGTDSIVARTSASSGSASKRLPSWVPAQPDEQTNRASSPGGTGGTGSTAETAGGPSLQGMGSTSSAPPQSGGSWSGVDMPGTGATSPGQGGAPGGGAWSVQPSTSATTGSPTGGVTKPTPGWRDVASRPSRSLAQPSRGRAGLAMPEPAGSPSTTTSGRPAATGQPGAAVGGVPVGGSGGSTEGSWPGYRRRPEPFPTSPRSVVPPLIEPATPEEEAELDEVATDYVDDVGHRITIRRPRD